MTERLITDIGGLPAEEIPREDYHLLFWEKQMIATFNVLQDRGVLVTDEFRRKVEEMSPEAYKDSTFYGRRLDGIAELLIEKNIITAEELEERTREILTGGTREHVA